MAENYNKRISMWAAPSVAGEVGGWGPWYASGAVITTPGDKASISFSVSSRAEAPSPYNIEVVYHEDGVLKTRKEVFADSGDITVNVGGEPNGSMSKVYVRAQSTTFGQELVLDPGPALSFLPGNGEPPDVTDDSVLSKILADSNLKGQSNAQPEGWPVALAFEPVMTNGVIAAVNVDVADNSGTHLIFKDAQKEQLVLMKAEDAVKMWQTASAPIRQKMMDRINPITGKPITGQHETVWVKDGEPRDVQRVWMNPKTRIVTDIVVPDDPRSSAEKPDIQNSIVGFIPADKKIGDVIEAGAFFGRSGQHGWESKTVFAQENPDPRIETLQSALRAYGDSIDTRTVNGNLTPSSLVVSRQAIEKNETVRIQTGPAPLELQPKEGELRRRFAKAAKVRPEEQPEPVIGSEAKPESVIEALALVPESAPKELFDIESVGINLPDLASVGTRDGLSDLNQAALAAFTYIRMDPGLTRENIGEIAALFEPYDEGKPDGHRYSDVIADLDQKSENVFDRIYGVQSARMEVLDARNAQKQVQVVHDMKLQSAMHYLGVRVENFEQSYQRFSDLPGLEPVQEERLLELYDNLLEVRALGSDGLPDQYAETVNQAEVLIEKYRDNHPSAVWDKDQRSPLSERIMNTPEASGASPVQTPPTIPTF